jgi:hypothetical protein
MLIEPPQYSIPIDSTNVWFVNTVIMQRSESKILTAIQNVPWYVTNHTLHTEFNIPYVSEVIHGRIDKHHNNLEAHPNPLLTLSSPVMPFDIILLILSFICYNLGGGGWKGLTLSNQKNATIFLGSQKL